MNNNTKTLKGRYWYFVDNLQTDDGAAASIRLYFALPVDHPGQKLTGLKIYPEPYTLIEDLPNGNRILVWEKAPGKNITSLTFYYDFVVEYGEVNSPVDPLKVIPADISSIEYQRYTISEGWLDITAEIVKRAKEIVGEEKNPYRAAKNIFTWVVKNMSYEYPDTTSRGASKSIASLKGDCAEFSAVFISLCRASGIPARPVTCNWIKGGGHQWAEIFLPPYGWVPVDPTAANIFDRDPAGEQARKMADVADIKTNDPGWFFGNLYPERLMVLVGENIKVRLSQDATERVFYLLQPGGSAAHPSAAEFSGFSSQPIHGGSYVFGDKREDEIYARGITQAELAESYFKAKLYDKAEAGLAVALKEKPKAAYRWLLLGQVYMAQGKYLPALEAFTSAIAGDGGSLKPVWAARAHFYSGNCLDMLGKRIPAAEEYRAVLASGVSFENLQERATKHLAKPCTKADL
ncbi:MAG TPA: hypothetical protein DCZ93_02060 [Elusimicrobia bacterium]|nr:hypothetical protein [Elusimicrobiota bacterium]